MRRLIASFALIAAASSIAAAQGEPPKPDSTKKEPAAAGHAGKWSGTVSTEQGNQEVWLTLKKGEDGKYSGSAGSQMGETPLYDIKVAGDTLSAGATLSAGGNNLDLWYTLLLKGETLSGSIDVAIQGQKMSLPVSFKKQP